MIDSSQSPRLLRAVEELLAHHGISSACEVTQLVSIGDHRQYRVRTKTDRFLLKQYFQNAFEPRDWLTAEFNFCQFLHRSGMEQVPEPIARDENEGLALYEFIDGRPLRRGEISDRKIDFSIDFVREINLQKRRPEARGLVSAHRAMFSVATHIRQVERRVQMLCAIDPVNSYQNEAQHFTQRELATSWARAAELIQEECSKLGIDLDAPLASDRRILSPANFGFHNVIRTRSGGIRFVNLESAGWDDPARLAGDFFFQPSFALEPRHLERFRAKVFADLSNYEFELRRSEIMLPLFKTHWCCRVLEDFIADSQPNLGGMETQERGLPWLSPVAAARRILNSGTPDFELRRAGDRQ